MFEDTSPAEDIFSAAWEQVRAGRSIESVLAAYPEHAAELEPMLRLSAAVQSAPHPTLSPQALARIERRARTAAARPRAAGEDSKIARVRPELSQTNARPSWWPIGLFPSSRLAVSAAVLLLVVGAAILTALAMNRSQSGEPVESYSGVINEMSATRWLVGDTEVFIDPTTEIHGRPELGAEITCLAVALQPGDRMRALEVWVRSGPLTPTPVPTNPSSQGSQGAVTPLSGNRQDAKNAKIF